MTLREVITAKDYPAALQAWLQTPISRNSDAAKRISLCQAMLRRKKPAPQRKVDIFP